jgi:ferredoxin
MQGITGMECDNCLACMSICPPDALHVALSPRRGLAATVTRTVPLEKT